MWRRHQCERSREWPSINAPTAATPARSRPTGRDFHDSRATAYRGLLQFEVPDGVLRGRASFRRWDFCSCIYLANNFGSFAQVFGVSVAQLLRSRSTANSFCTSLGSGRLHLLFTAFVGTEPDLARSGERRDAAVLVPPLLAGRVHRRQDERAGLSALADHLDAGTDPVRRSRPAWRDGNGWANLWIAGALFAGSWSGSCCSRCWRWRFRPGSSGRSRPAGWCWGCSSWARASARR